MLQSLNIETHLVMSHAARIALVVAAKRALLQSLAEAAEGAAEAAVMQFGT
jgi:hypothetical protein